MLSQLTIDLRLYYIVIELWNKSIGQKTLRLAYCRNFDWYHGWLEFEQEILMNMLCDNAFNRSAACKAIKVPSFGCNSSNVLGASPTTLSPKEHSWAVSGSSDIDTLLTNKSVNAFDGILRSNDKEIIQTLSSKIKAGRRLNK